MVGQGDVDGTGALRRGAREIERDRIALNFERKVDLERRIGDPVIVEEIMRLPPAIGQGFDL